MQLTSPDLFIGNPIPFKYTCDGENVSPHLAWDTPPDGTHRYFFKLYALDELLALPAGASKAQVMAAMEGHVLEAVELMGRYTRQS